MNIGQNQAFTRKDIAELRVKAGIVRADNTQGKPHNLVVVFHPGMSIQEKADVTGILASLGANAASIESSTPGLMNEHGIPTYNNLMNVVNARQDGRLSVVNRLVGEDPDVTNVKLMTFDRTPGWMVAEGRLAAIWTLILILDMVRWVILSPEDAIKAYRAGAQAA